MAPSTVAPRPGRHEHGAYRRDIDGLRGIAVLAVVAFHLGWLPHGYLGVDVFFVISGFLITGICLREADAGRFSITGFWMRRIRRILPLVCVVVSASLIVGALTMLPDDLENLAASVIATNLFANNILQAITTRDYWDVVNEYKPLMHTWSLGIEEQYYLIFPALVLLLMKTSIRFFSAALFFLALLSLGLYVAEEVEYRRFYLLQHRFFELATGGVIAVALHRRCPPLKAGWLGLLALLMLLTIDVSMDPRIRLMLVLLASGLLLMSDNLRDPVSGAVLSNVLIVFVGVISFSLYMWHQVVFAHARYGFLPQITPSWGMFLTAVCLGLSWLTWRFIERPFRDTRRTASMTVLAFVAAGLLTSSLGAAAIYLRGGVLRSVPELDIEAGSGERYSHQAYNHRILGYDRPFPEADTTKVLVVGNSFARDWANVLLESPRSKSMVLSYRRELDAEAASRMGVADVVYLYSADPDRGSGGYPEDRTWFIGSKSFGVSNGIFYNRPRDAQYCSQRALPDPTYLAADRRIRAFAGPRHIDILGRLRDPSGSVPVFTPECRFISMDTRHLTRAGAVFLAHLFADDITAHFARAGS